MKCWDAKAEYIPTANELCQILKKWVSEVKYNDDNSNNSGKNNELFDKNSEIYTQIKEYEEIRKNKLRNSSNEDIKPKNTQTHPQAIYTSSLLSFKNLPIPVNSECLDCLLRESGIF